MRPDDHEHTLYRDDSEYTAEQVVPDAIELVLIGIRFTDHIDYGKLKELPLESDNIVETVVLLSKGEIDPRRFGWSFPWRTWTLPVFSRALPTGRSKREFLRRAD